MVTRTTTFWIHSTYYFFLFSSYFLSLNVVEFSRGSAELTTNSDIAWARDIMADIGGYRHHVTGYPVMQDYYGACAAKCEQFSTANISGYVQYDRPYSYEQRPACKYPVTCNNLDISNVAPSDVVSRSARDTGSCNGDAYMSANFRSDCSKLVQRRTLATSTPVEIYPWMKETRQNHRRQNVSTLPGQLYHH